VEGSVAELAQYYGNERPPVVELPLNRVASAESSIKLEQIVSQWKKSAPEDVWPNWCLPADRNPQNPGLAMALALLPGTFIYQPEAELQTIPTSGEKFNLLP